ncbi:MAG: PAS domain-containing protein [Paracoccaceae bacterium]|nr:PAS domain-containing protein [Paracoccaceae bacterium]
MDRLTERDVISRRLELATRAARIAIWEWDYTDDTLYWSPVFMEILGIDPEEFQGQLSDFTDRVAPEDADRVSEALRAHLEEGVPYDIEYQMIRSDGRRVVIAATGQATFAEDGAPARMIGTVQDVSARRRLEDKLLRAEQIGKIGHWELDIAENTLSWSPETFRIHGLDPDDPQPSVEEAFEFYHPDDVGSVAANFEQVFETGQLHGVNARLILRNGEIRHVYADGISFTNTDGGRPTRVFGILHDRTEFVKKEEQLSQSRRLEAVGQLAGGIAHDFNNLLAVIQGNIELLQDDEQSREMSDQERRDTIASAIAATRSGADLTRNMLAFASKSQLEPKRVAINGLIAETESWLIRTVPSSIAVQTRLIANQQHSRLDPAGFQSAIVNVVVNARDAMPDGGKLTIETRNVVFDADAAAAFEGLTTGPYLAVTITDTGKGIAPELLARVFEPFVSTKAMSTGTGLGLSMVQGFARQSGGAVQITSELGVGTTVKMVFPVDLAEAPDETAPAQEAPSNPVSKTSARILIAEDQPEVLALLVRILKSAGYETETAVSGDQAFDIFTSNAPFDLLLTDVEMPGGMSGPQLANACRKLVRGLPVIFLSGYSSETITDGNGLPPEDMRLIKPVPKTELLQAITTVLSQPQPRH